MLLTKPVAVVGAGLMGTQIAACLSLSGYSVKVFHYQNSEEVLPRIKRYAKVFARKLALERETTDAALARIVVTSNLAELASCSIIIESIIEDLAAKQRLFQQLDSIAETGAIFATNTSALDVREIAKVTQRPERFVGLHFFNPVVEMELVEVVTNEDTDSLVKAECLSFIDSLGKTPICTSTSVVNRILIPMINEACLALEEGTASAEDIDRAMKLGAHHPIGPFALADLIGIDVVIRILETYRLRFGERYAPASTLYNLFEKGALGKKAGHGFFEYAGKERTSASFAS